ncbi:acetoacetate--CoA ligase [Pontibacterium granulatum]|uniref:acetoacetate--CoA ligase n=1 Tax=Pontibacterium granulatum TaxID=2036029 RepID=UPI00249C3EF3|nr:acetoacetate--CoA ligase [Pontibacterium granulatum]MDI3325533.1 acetoacetate--CoA ligase [Pontibacterium granulatum]
MSDPLWQPTAEQIRSCQMGQFMRSINSQHHQHLTTYGELHRWSIKHPQVFWKLLWAFTGVVASAESEHVLEQERPFYKSRWFPGAKLNFAENLLRYRDNQTALVSWNETGKQKSLTYAELYRQVAQLANAMKAHGIQPGDRIAGYLPNIPEAVIAMLATTSLGAVWTSCSPDFGVAGTLDRFGQIQPRMIFAADGYHYNGKELSSLNTIFEVSRRIDSVEHLVIVPYLSKTPDLQSMDNALLLQDFIAEESAQEIEFEQLNFNAPLYILYSSGTTGTPKCIIHGVGGTLLQHLKEHRLHVDLSRNDCLFYFTTCGWMMWNWLVSGLASGAKLVLYDGAPFAPEVDIFWRIAAEESISVMGVSAKYLSALEKTGIEPIKHFSLPALRAVLSTGSPLPHEGFHFVYRSIKSNLMLASISGGTDIISCFALGCPIRPVYAGEIQCRGLGMDVSVFDEHGQTVYDRKGELVCLSPFPSMPIGFWNDPEDQRYHQAYFDRFTNVWSHGDYAEITENDGMIIYGRSDAVLNPGGIRIGTAEIYRQVEQLDEVIESICIGQPWHEDERIVLFVRLQAGMSLSEELVDRIKWVIRQGTTPRHVPDIILQVADIPRTLSGKITELAVRNMVMGEPVPNTDALANPEALELYRNIPALQPSKS